MLERQNSPLRFRPHHFLCTLSFQGLGYSSSFVANFKKIKEILLKDETTQMIVVEGVGDAICVACPHLKSDATCEKEEKINRLDERHKAALRLKSGETLTWQEAKERIRSFISPETFRKICKGCPWQSLGLCENALKALLRESPLLQHRKSS